MLFLVVLFLIKSGFFSKNSISSLWNKDEGLIYDNTTVGELVYRDTDGDTIPDWEEALWGTDPTKKETTPGTPDTTVISKLKTSQELGLEDEQNLTETDKFSRELFSTIASLSQAGTIDQETVDKLSSSLIERIQNTPQRKIFTTSDIKITNDDSIAAFKKYNDTIDAINKKYPVQGDIIEILQKFIIDANNVDASVLQELDPIIKQVQNIINATLEAEVPQSIASLHIDFLNAGEKYIENLTDIKLYDTDPLMALSAITQFEKNLLLSETAIVKLKSTINQKLKI